MELLGRSFTSDVTYMSAEQHNMRDKEPDNTRAVLHLGHRQETGLRVGVFNTMEWMAKEMGL